MAGSADFGDLFFRRGDDRAEERDPLSELECPPSSQESGARYRQLELFDIPRQTLEIDGRTSELAFPPGYLVTFTLDIPRATFTLKISEDPDWIGPRIENPVAIEEIVKSAKAYTLAKDPNTEFTISVSVEK